MRLQVVVSKPVAERVKLLALSKGLSTSGMLNLLLHEALKLEQFNDPSDSGGTQQEKDSAELKLKKLLELADDAGLL